MLVDYHVHTEYSDDSVYPMEDVIKDAIRLGLDEICITDYVDYGVKADWGSGKEILYRHGEPLANVDYPRYVAQIEQMQRLYGDKITIKMGMEFGVQTHTIPQFEALFRLYSFDFLYPFDKVKSTIAEILKIVIADGKGIEVNTSSHRYGLMDSMPSAELLGLYKDLGGSIVTIGTDSHAPAHLGTLKSTVLLA
ncbi:MAG: PHP domain-containing protein [Lachnospiraceae bacterium]|nr:PHP domain-containing protein [Lachnospiraceae bacterium]